MAVTLAFQRFPYSDDDGVPLVILHGVLVSKTNWTTLAEIIMKDLKKTVIVVDVRNHGNSPSSPNMSYELMSDDIVQLLQTQHITTCIVIGHSVGGKIAMALALRYPNLIERLVVLDVAPVNNGPGKESVLQLIELLQSLNLASVKDEVEVSKELEKLLPDSDIRDCTLSNLSKSCTGELRWMVNFDAVKANIDHLFNFPTFSVPYCGPTLVLLGANSPSVRLEMHAEIIQLFPKAKIFTIEGAGHWVHYDKPYELMKALKEFIEQNH